MFQAFQPVKVVKEGDRNHGLVGNVRTLPTATDPAYYVQLDTAPPGVLEQFAADELAGL